jgi:hypothetical protein
MANRMRTAPLLLGTGLIVAACSDATIDRPDAQQSSSEVATTATAVAPGVDLPPAVVLDVPDPNSVYDPVRGGETLPDGFRQLLVRDAIAPVYDPTFTVADAVDWPDDSLVIGVDLEGEARAYPVGFLNRREIVNDNHRGIPTLVTW